METVLSIILILLATLGFVAELIQLDQLSQIEIKAKEISQPDENNEESKKKKEAEERIIFLTEPEPISVFTDPARSYYHISFTKGYIENLYNPPDLV